MVCWVCAGLSFWGAAAVLGICAIIEGIHAFHRARLHWPDGGPRLGQPAR